MLLTVITSSILQWSEQLMYVPMDAHTYKLRWAIIWIRSQLSCNPQKLIKFNVANYSSFIRWYPYDIARSLKVLGINMIISWAWTWTSLYKHIDHGYAWYWWHSKNLVPQQWVAINFCLEKPNSLHSYNYLVAIGIITLKR